MQIQDPTEKYRNLGYEDAGLLGCATLALIGGRLAGRAANLMLTAKLTAQVLKERTGGDLVECGVFAGCHPAVMAMSLAAVPGGPLSNPRRVYLLDSFAGIPKGGPRDGPDITALVGQRGDGDKIESSGASVCTEAQVRQHMTEWGVDPAWLCYRPGWFETTAAKVAREIGIKQDPGDGVPGSYGGIALLRIDGDLYDSVTACLTNLWPHVREGGFVVLDDYGLSGARAAIDEFHERVHYEPTYQHLGGDQEHLVWYRKSAADSMAARHEMRRNRAG